MKYTSLLPREIYRKVLSITPDYLDVQKIETFQMNGNGMSDVQVTISSNFGTKKSIVGFSEYINHIEMAHFNFCLLRDEKTIDLISAEFRDGDGNMQSHYAENWRKKLGAKEEDSTVDFDEATKAFNTWLNKIISQGYTLRQNYQDRY